MTTTTPEPKGLELNTIKRSMQPDVVSSFWTMLQELRGKANDDDDRVLKVQVEGWYRQWNRMTGDNKTPEWTVHAVDQPPSMGWGTWPTVAESYTGSRQPAEIAQRIQALVAEHMGVSMDDVALANRLADLGADSLDEIELVMALEDEFLIEITDEQAELMTTLDSAVQIVLRNLNQQSPI